MSVRMFARVLPALAFAVSCASANAAGTDKWHLRTLANLCSGFCSPGNSAPNGPLVTDANGNWYGSTAGGGVRGNGSVYELHRDPGQTKWRFRTIYNFCALNACADGGFPRGGVIVATDGNLYGTTTGGGSFGAGTFYRLTPNNNRKNWIIRVLYNFCSRNSACTDGGRPGGLTYRGAAAGLPYDFSGPLYGTTELFGGHGRGTVFHLRAGPAHQNWEERVLYRFCKSSGCPDGGGGEPLLLEPDGNLVGVTLGTNVNTNGLVYRLSPSADSRQWTQTILYTFCSQANCADGFDPDGGLVEDAAGDLFGVTAAGGNNNADCAGSTCGVVYEIAADGTESTLYRFCAHEKCRAGGIPVGALTLDGAGNLYGVTALGGKHFDASEHIAGGTVFELSGSSLKTLHAFCAQANCADGEVPATAVSMDSFGDLFGATEEGGIGNGGTVYELKPPAAP